MVTLTVTCSDDDDDNDDDDADTTVKLLKQDSLLRSGCSERDIPR